jgi:hypothetical protein
MVLEMYAALRKAGVDEDIAGDAARSVMGIEMKGDLATKSDLLLLRSELRSEMSELRSEMSGLRSEVSEIRLQVKADISELKAEIIKWNVGAMAILTAIVAAISRLG